MLDKSDADLVAPLVLASYLGGVSTAMIVLSGKAMPWRDSNVNSRDPAWLVDSSAMGASYSEAAGPERRPERLAHIGAIYSRLKS